MDTIGHSVLTKQSENACISILQLGDPLMWASANFYIISLDNTS